ncbi:hypothetical protein VCHENC02_2726B, partial [Vibrio harveyi]
HIVQYAQIATLLALHSHIGDYIPHQQGVLFHSKHDNE